MTYMECLGRTSTSLIHHTFGTSSKVSWIERDHLGSGVFDPWDSEFRLILYLCKESPPKFVERNLWEFSLKTDSVAVVILARLYIECTWTRIFKSFERDFVDSPFKQMPKGLPTIHLSIF